ncbi:hypothetical protein ACIGHB_26520 [Streptomyces sp. NPDC085460]|uniref:hypothetical protein n=1 Tax=Streptomyces sp. NPDC085460 TaxID=3365723 RepID=UPI0037CD6DB4
MALFATACAGEKPEPERVTAEQQCDGSLSPEAARALETVLKTKRFSAAGEGGLERVTNELAEDYTKFPLWTHGRDLCEVNHPGNSGRLEIELRLRRDDDPLGGGHAANLHRYDMGADALSGPGGADIVLFCVSPRFRGSDKRPARVQGALTLRKAKLPDTVPVREANLTVLHSVTFAVVRKLGCEDDAGLTEKPVFKALPE